MRLLMRPASLISALVCSLVACSSASRLSVADVTSERRSVLDTLPCSAIEIEGPVIYFEPMSSELSEEAQVRLVEYAYQLGRCASFPLQIRGYVDFTVEEIRVSEQLSQERAGAVARELVRLGIDAELIVCARGWGGSELRLGPGSSLEEREAWRSAPRHRRTEMFAYGGFCPG